MDDQVYRLHMAFIERILKVLKEERLASKEDRAWMTAEESAAKDKALKVYYNNNLQKLFEDFDRFK